MMFLCEKESVRPGVIFDLPAYLKSTADKILKGYNPNLFSKWNITFQRWEVWEKGNRGKDYLVMIVENPEVDYRIIEELDNRAIQKNEMKRRYLVDEVDGINQDVELQEDLRLSQRVFDISVETFNKVMKNPVIEGMGG